MDNRSKGILLAVGGSILWGASGVAGQYLFQDKGMTTEWLVVVRLLLAGCLLLAMDYHIAGRRLHRIFEIWWDAKSCVHLLLFGFVGMMAVQYTYFAAIRESNAATGTILEYLMPLIILIWTSLSRRKLPKRGEIICVFLVIIGAAILVTGGSFSSLAISKTALFWGIAAAFSAAFYTVQPRWLMMNWRSTQVVGWGMLLGGIPLAVIYPPINYPGTFDFGALVALLYLVVFGTAIAFWAYITSLKYIRSQETSILNAVEPLASIIFMVLLLGEPFGMAEWIGALMIICPIGYIVGQKS